MNKPADNKTPNPIYAAKLTMAHLTASSVSWLSAAESVVSQLSEAVPLADWHPLEQLDLPTETVSKGKLRRAARAQPQKQRRQPTPEHTKRTLFSDSPSEREKQSLSARAPQGKSHSAGQNAERSGSQAVARPQSQLSQLAQLSQMQLDKDSSVSSSKRNSQPLEDTHSEVGQMPKRSRHEAIASASVQPSVLQQRNSVLSSNKSSASLGASSSDAFSQSAVEEAVADPSLNAIDTIDRITRQLLSKDSPPKSLRQSSLPASPAADRPTAYTTASTQPVVQSSANSLTSLLSPTANSSHASTAESTFLSELTAQSSAHLTPSVGKPTTPTAQPPDSVANPIVASGFDLSPAIAETLTDWVNGTLKEQAHRHGVDLS